MIKTREAIEDFVNTKSCRAASNLFSKDNKLFNWTTVIAQWFGDILVINNTWYSRTTTKHQNKLFYYAEKNRIPHYEVFNVPFGKNDLTKYYEKVC